MLSRDEQRLEHILEYCKDIAQTTERFGNEYVVFHADKAYHDLICFIFSRSESFPVSFQKNYGQYLMKSHGVKLRVCVILSHITMAAFGWKSFGIQ